MAFPTVVATNGGNSGGNTTTTTINLPDGSNVVGRLLVVIVYRDGTSGTPVLTWPSGWTAAHTDNAAQGHVFAVRYRIIDGSESYPSTGATISLTHTTEGTAHNTYLIEDGTFDDATPVTAGTVATGATGVGDPPNCNPGVAADYLWIACASLDGNGSHTASPTNYGTVLNNRWANTNGGGVGSATRNLNASAENPGTFTQSGNFNWQAQTLAIHPAAAGAVTVEPGVGALTIAGFAPTIGLPQTVTPGVGGLTISGFAPTIGLPQTVTPGVGSVVLTGYAPTLETPITLTPGVGGLTITGYAAVFDSATGVTVEPGVGALVITGFEPTISTPVTVEPGVGSVVLTGHAPTFAAPVTVTPGVGGLTITGYSAAFQVPTTVAPGTGGVTITGFAPTLSLPVTVSPGTGAVVITGFAATFDTGEAAPPRRATGWRRIIYDPEGAEKAADAGKDRLGPHPEIPEARPLPDVPPVPTRKLDPTEPIRFTRKVDPTEPHRLTRTVEVVIDNVEDLEEEEINDILNILLDLDEEVG